MKKKLFMVNNPYSTLLHQLALKQCLVEYLKDRTVPDREMKDYIIVKSLYFITPTIWSKEKNYLLN